MARYIQIPATLPSRKICPETLDRTQRQERVITFAVLCLEFCSFHSKAYCVNSLSGLRNIQGWCIKMVHESASPCLFQSTNQNQHTT